MDGARRSERDQKTRRTPRGAILSLVAAGVTLALLSLLPRTPLLVWNVSASVPVGLYHVVDAAPRRGDILLIQPDADLAALLKRIGGLRDHPLLLKPLAGLPGETFCRHGAVITLHDRPVAEALASLDTGAPLPAWSGCRRLGEDELAVLSSHPRSFDSRYFGPVRTSEVLGLARPLFTLIDPREAR